MEDSPKIKPNANTASRAWPTPHSSSTLRSNASSVFFYYNGGQRRRSRPFTYGFGVGGGRKRSKRVQNWIRGLTVCAYFALVSSPALLLSFYYTRVWDPTYVNQMVSQPTNGTMTTLLMGGNTKKFMPQRSGGMLRQGGTFLAKSATGGGGG